MLDIITIEILHLIKNYWKKNEKELKKKIIYDIYDIYKINE
jgi:hypothetical protein